MKGVETIKRMAVGSRVRVCAHGLRPSLDVGCCLWHTAPIRCCSNTCGAIWVLSLYSCYLYLYLDMVIKACDTCVRGAGNIERVRGLVFDCLRQRRMALHSMLLAVAATWPQVLIKTGLLVLVAAEFRANWCWFIDFKNKACCLKCFHCWLRLPLGPVLKLSGSVNVNFWKYQ